MSTSSSSTARSSSSSSRPARSVDEPHLHLPAVKEIIPVPKKAKTPPSPRMTLAREEKVLRQVKKKKILKTAKGSIAKVRRRYPGTASLRDTSSEGSVSSRGSSGIRSKLKLKLVPKTNLAPTDNETVNLINDGDENSNHCWCEKE